MTRKAVFYAIAFAIPVIFFLVVEAGLRLGGYGGEYPLFLELERHPGLFYPNTELANRYFRADRSLPSIPFDYFEAVKQDDALRIFIQGGSTAAGFPYNFGASLSDILEDRLDNELPGRQVEVVGTAMAAVNSFTLLDLVDEILAQEPDAVIIYAGHNEFYGALGAASTESYGGSPATTRLYLSIAGLRTVQLVRDGIAGLISAASQRPGDSKGATLMAQMVGEQSIPFGSPLFERGVRQFEDNLDRLLTRYEQAGVPVVLATLASNERDQPPFVFDRSDPANAMVAFERARQLEAEGDTAGALAAYLKAKDRDELRFRAPEVLNEIIRQKADEYGAALAETQAALRQASSPFGIGNEVMTEHLHPNGVGYYVLTEAVYDALAGLELWDAESLVSADSAAATSGPFTFSVLDSLLGDLRIRVLKASWPFQPLGSPFAMTDFPDDTEEERIATRVYAGDLGRPDGLEMIRVHQMAEGRFGAAVETNRAILQRYDFVEQPHLSMGDVLVEAGRPNEALTSYARANEISETQHANLSIGAILVQTGQPDEAFQYYERANRLSESQVAQRMMGSISLNRGDTQRAIGFLERAVALDGADLSARYNLAGAYALTQQFQKARVEVEALLELSPDHVAGRRLLESLPANG